jgi:hypothetical protein
VYGETYNECEKKPRRTKVNRTKQCLLYADNVVVLGRAVKYISETREDMTSVASHIGKLYKHPKPNI